VARGDAGVFGDPVPAAALPPVPDGRVAYVDGFGNLKTTWRWGALPAGLEPGAAATVAIGGRTVEARVAGGAFAVPEGMVAVAPGSSGYVDRRGRSVRWVEVFLRGGDAAAAFGAVRPGDAVALVPV
jgi:S-adenosylmethionine hydrolase